MKHSALMTVSISDTQLNNALPLRWVLRFIYCYAECRYAECRGAAYTTFFGWHLLSAVMKDLSDLNLSDSSLLTVKASKLFWKWLKSEQYESSDQLPCSGTNIIKHFTSALYECFVIFAPGWSFQPSLLFASKVGACPSEAPFRSSTVGWARGHTTKH